MGKYAIVEDSVVVNVARADSPLGPNWVATQDAGPGWLYTSGVFIPPPDPARNPSDVAAERDRRLRLDFEFEGVMYQRDSISVQRIAGAAQMASLAIAAGAQPGDLFWHGGEQPFGWIASDDTVTPMDAQTVVAFGMAAAARETLLIFAARDLRQMEPIPTDFADDRWWP